MAHWGRKKRRQKIHWKSLVILLILIVSSICIFKQIDYKILPSAIAISELEAKKRANILIDRSVNSLIQEMNVTAEDFFKNDGKFLYANTILINEMCANVSHRITKNIEGVTEEKIEVPIGALTGFEMFSGIGPSLWFTMRPGGETKVDYETEFNGVGINQTNFKVWITITINIRLINPLRSEGMTLTRKLMLVDTVIQGEVPNGYFQLNDQAGSPLTFPSGN